MISPAAMPTRLDLSLRDFAATHDLVLCDVWGVVHNGVARHPAAVDALVRFRRGGGTVILITNAPAPRAQVQRRLDRLGVPREAYDGIATSGDVTIEMIVAAGCPPVFNIGPRREVALYEAAGRLGPRVPALVGVDAAAMAICVGLDETGDEPAAYDALLKALLDRKLELVCANPDIVVEVGDTLVYCAGAIAERYAAMGGVVVQAGKPFPPIYAMAFAMAAAIRGPIAKGRVLAIGDAMHTDMRGAADQRIASLLITSGIHRALLHRGDRASAVDEAALRRFLSQYDDEPTAALPVLGWGV
jgi:HAD superfamily hydrolase (TIGR01459 family)